MIGLQVNKTLDLPKFEVITCPIHGDSYFKGFGCYTCLTEFDKKGNERWLKQ